MGKTVPFFLPIFSASLYAAVMGAVFAAFSFWFRPFLPAGIACLLVSFLGTAVRIELASRERELTRRISELEQRCQNAKENEIAAGKCDGDCGGAR
jgi:hypothetical protein